LASAIPAWAQEVRDAATQNLATLPALTGEEEAWRFTPPSDLALTGSEPEAPGAAGAVVVEDGVRAARLRLADGVARAPELLDLPEGVIVAELGAALEEHEALVRDRLYGLIGFGERPEALNAANWDGGLFVYVPRGVQATLPVEAILTASGARGRIFGRTLVVVEEGAKATVIDRYASPEVSGPVQASTVVELYVGQGAELEHISVIDWGAGVRHHAALDRERCGRDAPALRGRGDQHRARGRTGLAQLFPRVGDRGGATGALRGPPQQVVVARSVGGCALDLHLPPRGVELVGDDRRQPRVGALAHLQVLAHHRHRVVGADPDEGIGREGRTGLRGGSLRGRRHVDAEDQPGGERAASLEEAAAGDVFDADVVHRHVSVQPSAFAASLIAARMRG